MKWIYLLVIGAVIIILGYFIVTSMQSPSSSMSTTYSIGGNSYPSNPMTNPETQNSIEIPVQTERPLAPMTSSQVNTGTMQGVLYSTPSQPSGAVVVGTGQYAGDKWIVMGPGQGTHIEAL